MPVCRAISSVTAFPIGCSAASTSSRSSWRVCPSWSKEAAFSSISPGSSSRSTATVWLDPVPERRLSVVVLRAPPAR